MRPAETPEALMRSRYSAFVSAAADYLLTTWHPRTRPAALVLDDQPHWQCLEMVGSGQSADGLSGWVEFAAHYQTPAGTGCLRERSRFLREQGRWLYLDGTHPPVAQAALPRVGRNTACPCGSGRKFKQCCGR
jgi:SEC-C motif domain protein